MDYETLKVIWWGLVLFLLIGFVVMDGFDARGRQRGHLKTAVGGGDPQPAAPPGRGRVGDL